MKQIMVDIEGLGTQHPFVILSVGAVEFDLETGDTGKEFYVTLDSVDQQRNYGMQVDAATVNWWLWQEKEAQEALFEPKPKSLDLALRTLNDYVRSVGREVEVWSHVTYDQVALAAAYRAAGIKPAWSFRDARDIRTLQKLAGKMPNIERVGTHHNALDDAKFQAKYVSAMWRKINGI